MNIKQIFNKFLFLLEHNIKWLLLQVVFIIFYKLYFEFLVIIYFSKCGYNENSTTTFRHMLTVYTLYWPCIVIHLCLLMYIFKKSNFLMIFIYPLGMAILFVLTYILLIFSYFVGGMVTFYYTYIPATVIVCLSLLFGLYSDIKTFRNIEIESNYNFICSIRQKFKNQIHSVQKSFINFLRKF